MTITRRALGGASLGLIGAAIGARGAAAQGAEPFPGNRPVTLVVSWAPGGSSDFTARLLAQGMSRTLPGNVVVDNRPGAVGTIGHASVARARPDGHTLLVGVNSTYAMSRHLIPTRGYNDERDFVGIGRIAVSPIFLCVNPRLGVTDIAGLVARAKAEPGRLSYGSSGAGSSAHLATEMFLRAAGIEVQNVTYRGGAPAVQALVANEVQMAFVDAVTALPLMAANSITAIGLSALERSPLAPNVPTIAESGFPGFEATTNWSLMGPAGLPAPIVQRLHAAMTAALNDPEVRDRLRQNAIIPVVGTPDAFPAYLAAESAKWEEVIRTRGIRLE
jgi:tripartite-type tricarboxylate transporter receptor subunit TctC